MEKLSSKSWRVTDVRTVHFSNPRGWLVGRASARIEAGGYRLTFNGIRIFEAHGRVWVRHHPDFRPTGELAEKVKRAVVKAWNDKGKLA